MDEEHPKKPREIIYSAQHSDFVKGKRYANPRFFSTPKTDATKVFIIGKYPNIVAAYKALDIEVVQMKEGDALPTDDKAKGKPTTGSHGAKTPDASEVEIPAKWADLNWQAKRSLAKKLGGEAVNKEQAEKVITAEVARRAAK